MKTYVQIFINFKQFGLDEIDYNKKIMIPRRNVGHGVSRGQEIRLHKRLYSHG